MSWPLAIITRALDAFGCAARAVVFVLVGVFILKAAVRADAKQTKGLDAVFRSVASPGLRLMALSQQQRRGTNRDRHIRTHAMPHS